MGGQPLLDIQLTLSVSEVLHIYLHINTQIITTSSHLFSLHSVVTDIFPYSGVLDVKEW